MPSPGGTRLDLGCRPAVAPVPQRAGATNHFESGGFIRSNDAVAYPNLMFHFLRIAIRYDGSAPNGHGYQVHVGPMYSDTCGSVKVVSTDPRVHPALRFNYLSTGQDRREWVEAVRCARTILTQHAFDPYNDGEISPGTSVETDEEILDWVARETARLPCVRPARARWAPGPMLLSTVRACPCTASSDCVSSMRRPCRT